MQSSEAISASSLSAAFLEYIKVVRGFSPATIRTYSYVLRCFVVLLGAKPIDEFTLPEIDNLIALFVSQRQLKPSSANTVRCVLRAFFMYVDRYRGIRLKFDYSMIRQMRSPRSKIHFVATDELMKMIGALHTYQDRLMMMTMYATGMRIGELVHFNVEDFHEGEIQVRGKGGKDRVIPVEPILDKELKSYISNHNISVGPVFKHQVSKLSQPNQAYTVSGLRKRWYRQLEPAGLYHKPHDLRHGTATKLLLNGMDIRTLQTFLGHSHIATTMLYTHITDSHLRESFLKFSPTKGLDLQNVLDIS